MTEPIFKWLITDLSEIEIRGTDDVPIIVSRPYWSLVETKYSNFTAVIHSGRKKFSYTFHSDDIEIALKVMENGGTEKEISKALATNIMYGERLMKHCVKLAERIKKTNKKVVNKRNINKKVVDKKDINKKVKETDQIAKEVLNLKVDLTKDINIKLNNWM